MISDALGYTFDPCSYSDHDLVSVKFNCKRTFDRGPGLWKFNSIPGSKASFVRTGDFKREDIQT